MNEMRSENFFIFLFFLCVWAYFKKHLTCSRLKQKYVEKFLTYCVSRRTMKMKNFEKVCDPYHKELVFSIHGCSPAFSG